MNIQIVDYQSTSAAGIDINTLWESIVTQRSGLQPNDLAGSELSTWIGKVAGLESIDLGPWQSRNNALAALCLRQGTLMSSLEKILARFPVHRVAVIIGSSTSSIDRTELAYSDLSNQGQLKSQYRQTQVHNPHAPGLFAAHFTGLSGPALTINTACSSSAKVFATAARWLQSGVIDAALVGGVDSLGLSVLHGFASLQLLSPQPCRPFDQQRDGINLGEAAGFAILVRPDAELQNCGIALRGYGESSDAHHMSHPHPEGSGARLAIEQALAMANCESRDIDYINLHGTASRINDQIEGQLIAATFPQTTQCSSTKAWMGHTLGAAGITEALITIEALRRGIIPGSLNLQHLDEPLRLNIRAENQTRPIDRALSNSFGFGGNNCCLVFSRADSA